MVSAIPQNISMWEMVMVGFTLEVKRSGLFCFVPQKLCLITCMSPILSAKLVSVHVCMSVLNSVLISLLGFL